MKTQCETHGIFSWDSSYTVWYRVVWTSISCYRLSDYCRNTSRPSLRNRYDPLFPGSILGWTWRRRSILVTWALPRHSRSRRSVLFDPDPDRSPPWRTPRSRLPERSSLMVDPRASFLSLPASFPCCQSVPTSWSTATTAQLPSWSSTICTWHSFDTM